MKQTIIILILSLILGVSTSYFIIQITLLKKKLKSIKNTCIIIGEDIYDVTSRMYSGNVSHSKGNIQNMANLIKQIGENNHEFKK